MENRFYVERLKKMEWFDLKKDVKEFNLRVFKKGIFIWRLFKIFIGKDKN